MSEMKLITLNPLQIVRVLDIDLRTKGYASSSLSLVTLVPHVAHTGVHSLKF